MGRWVFWSFAIGFLGVISGTWLYVEAQPQDPAEAFQKLRPGLIVSYRNSGQPPQEFTTIEPGIALALKATEAPHPNLAADGWIARWQGQLKVLRPDKYRFSANLRGKIKLTVAGKEALTAEVPDKEAALRQGPEIALAAGIHPIIAEFTKLSGPARVQAYWHAPHFRAEPLPHDAIGHLPEEVPPRLATDQLIEKGRFLAEEHACTACHQPRDDDAAAKGLKNRQAPDLSRAGERLKPEWIAPWLQAPHKLQPQTAMPDLFQDNPQGKVEVYAVTRYLTSLGGPIKTPVDKTNPKEVHNSIARGERMFSLVGCAACHSSGKHALDGIGSKTTVEQLAKYLQDPLVIDPSGRMPNMLLGGQEALDLARSLCKDTLAAAPIAAPPGNEAIAAFERLESRADERAEFKGLAEGRQWAALGQRIAIEKRCNSCHTIAPGGKPFAKVWAEADFDQIRRPDARDKGCLSEKVRDAAAPHFSFSKEDREALAVFLVSARSASYSLAPAHAARVSLQRFNCLACHVHDGQGGLGTELIDRLRQLQGADNAEAVSPPPLTGVGTKLNTPWLRQVLTQAGRARPWMGLRMPQFGEANVGHLPEGLAALGGVEPNEKPQHPPYDRTHLEAGRHLVSTKAFGCIACHDLAGVPAGGTRGPDLALMQQRVRHEWYRRWLEQPHRMQPGTRMPTIFPDGRTSMELLGGSADAQADAMWTYLSLGMSLPLPDGLGAPPGLALAVKDKPVILRTFMPDAGTKAIAAGYPGQVSVAFDAATCRLAYAWSGNFLDASPVWNDRGGNPAKLLGPRFWESPRGFPWAFSSDSKPPDFAAQMRDPVFGAAMPEGKAYQGPMQLRFHGYTTNNTVGPTFTYGVRLSEEREVEIREWLEPQRQPVAVGIARHFEFSRPPGVHAWLLAGETAGEPRVLNDKGAEIKLDLRQPSIEQPAASRMVLLPQGGDRMYVLKLGEAAPEAGWVLQRVGGSWQVLLHLPGSQQQRPSRVTVFIWQPYRTDTAMIRELLGSGATKRE